jgi:hypothetical protein
MLQQKTFLKETLYSGSYDRLAFWPDGSWSDVGTGYAGEQSGDNPVTYLSRANFYGATRKESALMVKAIGECIKLGVPYTVVFEKLKLGV